MEPEPKKQKLDLETTALHIPCIMVMETLQDLASKQGLHFEHTPRRFKKSLPHEKTRWFYNFNSLPGNGKRNGLSRPVLCKKMLVKAHQLKAMKVKKACSFCEVEYIADFKVIEGKRYYLVKWVGWPKEANTWESVSNLSCSQLIEEFHVDYTKQLNLFLSGRNLNWHKLFRRRGKKESLLQYLFNVVPNNFHFQAEYASKKQETLAKLLSWQTRINALTRGTPLIAVENEVDLEPLPESFTYIEQNIAGVGVCIPTDPLLGCSCVGSCSLPLEAGQCCPATHRSKPAYVNGLVKLKPGKPIFECNSRCQCGLSCPNRVVQKGPQLAMSLYRTTNGKGWGVKALEPIAKGAFVMEYVGEVITNDEAERRGKIYDVAGITYLFDLDFSDAENPLTVDATNYGNISHFVNHSCSPNLQVYNVFIDNIDPSFPRIALFARRNIAINEELTFDYQMTGDMTDGQEDLVPDLTANPMSAPPGSAPGPGNDDAASDVSRSSSCSSILKRTKCLCGSSNCRGWLI